jgi:drug/metabolite transporter (DMT)-like permease
MRTGLVFALTSAALYGLNIPFARLASFSDISGSSLVVYRVLLMFVLVTAFAGLARGSIAVPRGERRIMALLGLSSTLIGVCYISSVAFVPVAVAVVLFYTFPILIVLASPLIEGTRLAPPLLGIAGLALLGVGLVVGPALDGLDWRGVGLALAASVATATQFFAAARPLRTNIVAKVFWIHLFVLPAAALIGLATAGLVPPTALAADPLSVGIVIGAYVTGFVLQLLALARIPAVMAGIAYCLEPVAAVATSTLILREGISPMQMLGGVLVLAAIIANVIREQRLEKGASLVPAADRPA